MNLGDAFLMRIPGQNIDHLWFVISDPSRHPAYIIVNLTKDAARAANECPMYPAGPDRPADHDWIREPCYVNFADALEITVEKAVHMRALLKMGSIKMRAAVRPEVLRRIVEAARKSTALPIAYKKYLT